MKYGVLFFFIFIFWIGVFGHFNPALTLFCSIFGFSVYLFGGGRLFVILTT